MSDTKETRNFDCPETWERCKERACIKGVSCVLEARERAAQQAETGALKLAARQRETDTLPGGRTTDFIRALAEFRNMSLAEAKRRVDAKLASGDPDDRKLVERARRDQRIVDITV
jgi:hypothetical protein